MLTILVQRTVPSSEGRDINVNISEIISFNSNLLGTYNSGSIKDYRLK